MFFVSLASFSAIFIKIVLEENLPINQLKKILFILFLQIVFFALYEQIASSLIVFLKGIFDPNESGGDYFLPLTFFQSIDPFLNLTIGIMLISLWKHYLKNESGIFVKNIVGFLSLFFGFMMVSTVPGSEAKAMKMVIIFSFIVIGELLIVPTALTYFNVFADKKVKGKLMGLLSLGISIGQCTSAFIAHSTLDNANRTSIYTENFINIYKICAYLAITVSVLSLVYYVLQKSDVQKTHSKH